MACGHREDVYDLWVQGREVACSSAGRPRAALVLPRRRAISPVAVPDATEADAALNRRSDGVVLRAEHGLDRRRWGELRCARAFRRYGDGVPVPGTSPCSVRVLRAGACRQASAGPSPPGGGRNDRGVAGAALPALPVPGRGATTRMSPWCARVVGNRQVIDAQLPDGGASTASAGSSRRSPTSSAG